MGTDLNFLYVGKEDVPLKHAELRVTVHGAVPPAGATLVLGVGQVSDHH